MLTPIILPVVRFQRHACTNDSRVAQCAVSVSRYHSIVKEKYVSIVTRARPDVNASK
jgi:hypothetical protein